MLLYPDRNYAMTIVMSLDSRLSNDSKKVCCQYSFALVQYFQGIFSVFHLSKSIRRTIRTWMVLSVRMGMEFS